MLARPTGTTGHDLWTLDGNLLWRLAVTGRHDAIEAAYQRARGRVAEPRAAGRMWEHIVENACASWTETGQWWRALELIRAARPYCAEAHTMSDLREARIELRRTGILPNRQMWVASMTEPGWQRGPTHGDRAVLVAEWAGMVGDRSLLRRAASVLWDTDPIPAYSDVLWSAVRDLARCEADLAVYEPDPSDRPAAAAHLARIREVADLVHRLGQLGEVWPVELEAQLARFRGEDASELFQTALNGWQELGHEYDAATCHLYLAEAAASAGAHSRARDHAQHALSMASRLEAKPLATRADRLLGRLGGRGTSTGGLTARELEVLALLCQGRTNAQIASTLFISPKTASVHVSRILTKLGAANRTEATIVARARGLL